jgi:hypothetical protein
MGSDSRFRRLHTALAWVAVGLAAAFALRRLDNSDTWWHLAAGRWIAENGAVPFEDTLSYSASGHEWINLQWLHDLVLYLLYRIGGANALVVVSTGAYASAFAILVVHLRRSLGPLATTCLTIWVLLVCQDRFAVRPEMVSFVLLQIVLWLLSTMRESDGRRLWLLVPLTLLWVNLHALFILGIFAVGCALGATLLAEYVPLPATWLEGAALPPHVRRRLWAAAALSAIAALVNPYLVRGTLFPFELLSRIGPSSPFRAIGEFRSPFAAWFPDATIGAFQALFIFGCVVVLAAVAVSILGPREGSGARRRFDVAGLLIFAGLAVLAALAYRNAALFALGAAPFLGRCLATLGTFSRRTISGWRAAGNHAVAAVLLFALVGGYWLVATNRYYRWDGRTHEFGGGILEVNFPIRAAEFVDEMDLPGPLYNDLTAGGYLTWARPNGERVYIDGRLEVYDRFYSEYSASLRDPGSWTEQSEKFGINCVLLFHGWANRHPLIGWLDRNPAWSLVYFDEVAVVFVRDRGHQETVERARAAFQERYAQTLERLDRPPRGWGYPVGRVVAWSGLGRLFDTLGDPSRAAECYEAARAYDRPSSVWRPGSTMETMRLR